MSGIIYKAENKINGKIYIGKTVRSLSNRKNEHKCGAKSKNKDYYFYQAINKYGFESFKWEIIDAGEKSILNQLERLHISRYESNNKKLGYNLTEGGEGRLGYSTPIETRIKISKANKGNVHSQITRKKISEALKGRPSPKYWQGKKLSAEHKLKIGAALKGKYCGRVVSEETRQNLSKSHMGYKMPISQKKNIAKSNMNKGLFNFTAVYSLKNRKPWLRVWASKISYNSHRTSLGMFNDPLSADIVYNLVYNEIY